MSIMSIPSPPALDRTPSAHSRCGIDELKNEKSQRSPGTQLQKFGALSVSLKAGLHWAMDLKLFEYFGMLLEVWSVHTVFATGVLAGRFAKAVHVLSSNIWATGPDLLSSESGFIIPLERIRQWLWIASWDSDVHIHFYNLTHFLYWRKCHSKRDDTWRLKTISSGSTFYQSE